MPHKERLDGLKREMMQDLEVLVRSSPGETIIFWERNVPEGITLEASRKAVAALSPFEENSSYRVTSLAWAPHREVVMVRATHFRDFNTLNRSLADIKIEGVARVLDFAIDFKEKEAIIF